MDKAAAKPTSIFDAVNKSDKSEENFDFEIRTMPKKFLSMRPVFRSGKTTNKSFSLKNNLIIGIIVVVVIGALMVLAAVLFINSLDKKEPAPLDLPEVTVDINKEPTNIPDNTLNQESREALLNTDNWTLFDNSQYNYTLKYPSQWSLAPATQFSSGISPVALEVIGLKDDLTKLILEVFIIDNSLKSELTAWLSEQNISVPALENFRLDNNPAYKYVDEVNSNYLIYTSLGNYIYALKFSTTDDFIDLQIQNKLLANFSFINIPQDTNDKIDEIEGSNLLPAADSDKDGLTDLEEDIYSSDKNNRDTDNDGYTDGDEVANLFHPLIAGDVRIYDSPLVVPYRDSLYNYSLYYPQSWSAQTADNLAMFQADTGEFIQVLVIDDAIGYTAVRDWYQDNISSTDNLNNIKIAGQTGVRTPDGLKVYLLRDYKVYQLIYNINIRSDANFMTTFDMIVKSFKFD